jgi:hypothetical protein
MPLVVRSRVPVKKQQWITIHIHEAARHAKRG